MDLPDELAAAVAAETAGRPTRDLAADARRLSHRYRAGQPTRTGDDLAYLVARLPATYAAVAAVMAAARARLPGLSPRSLTDVGAGPGTAAWAGIKTFPALREIMLVDRHQAMLEMAKRLGERSSHAALRQARAYLQDATTTDPPPADILVAAYALAEVAPAGLETTGRRLWQAAASVLIVVEPGTPDGYRRVMRLRTLAVSLGAHVAAPCPHDGACPLTSGDWCHFPARLGRSRALQDAKDGRRSFEDEKYSYVVLSRQAPAAIFGRVIDRPRQGRGQVELRLCTKDGVAFAQSSRKDGEHYRALRRSAWGDALLPPGPDE